MNINDFKTWPAKVEYIIQKHPELPKEFREWMLHPSKEKLGILFDMKFTSGVFTFLKHLGLNSVMLSLWSSEFRRVHGHCEVPHRGRQAVLGRWVIRQRGRWHHSGREGAPFSRWQKQLLDKLGFDWAPNESRWQTRLAELKAHQRRYGVGKLPSQEANPVLGAWLAWQRKRERCRPRSGNGWRRSASSGIPFRVIGSGVTANCAPSSNSSPPAACRTDGSPTPRWAIGWLFSGDAGCAAHCPGTSGVSSKNSASTGWATRCRRAKVGRNVSASSAPSSDASGITRCRPCGLKTCRWARGSATSGRPPSARQARGPTTPAAG